jgi:hypothetical protein
MGKLQGYLVKNVEKKLIMDDRINNLQNLRNLHIRSRRAAMFIYTWPRKHGTFH